MKNNIWMDIEIREDIDDILTFIYALENDYDIRYVSIHNPSIKELTILQNISVLLQKELSMIISGEITTYAFDQDIHSSLFKYLDSPLDIKNFIYLSSFLETTGLTDDITFFCGGSLFTLSKVFEINNNISAYIQGGYAGSNIIPAEIALKKFGNRESIPTWNLNLDIEASDFVLRNHTSKLFFISKNICHKSEVSQDLLTPSKSFFQEVLFDYYECNEINFRNKAMHDLLAFLALDEDILLIEFKEVYLSHGNEDRPKWKSELKEGTNTFISVDFNYSLFLEVVLS